LYKGFTGRKCMIALSEDKFYEEIGERIREKRIEAGINQEVFSQLLNLTRGSVVNIEKGRQRPSIYLLITIAQIIGVDYIDLVPMELNIQRLPKAVEKPIEINFDEVVSSSADLNQKVKTSVNEFISQLKRK
jgi:transcriptional regulator with XRE-family HTH domain